MCGEEHHPREQASRGVVYRRRPRDDGVHRTHLRTVIVAHDQQGISLFTAIREQRGLELRPRRQPIEVVVIDSAQLPSGD